MKPLPRGYYRYYLNGMNQPPILVEVQERSRERIANEYRYQKVLYNMRENGVPVDSWISTLHKSVAKGLMVKLTEEEVIAFKFGLL